MTSLRRCSCATSMARRQDGCSPTATSATPGCGVLTRTWPATTAARLGGATRPCAVEVLAARAPDIMTILQVVSVPVMLLVTLALSSVALPLLPAMLAAAPGVTTSGTSMGVLVAWHLRLFLIILLDPVVVVVGLADITTNRKDVDMQIAVPPPAVLQREACHVLRHHTMTVAAVASSHNMRVCLRTSSPASPPPARPRWRTSFETS